MVFSKIDMLRIIIVLLLVSGVAKAQTQLGLKISPSVVSNRVGHFSDTISFAPSDLALRFMLGITADIKLSDTYSFGTGLTYVPKAATFTRSSVGSGTTASRQEVYRMHYLQIPLTLKFFTNEFQPDWRMFFQIGGTADVKIFDEPTDRSFDTVESFRDYDATATLGAGVEFAAGLNTILTLGVSYYRGLFNIIEKSVPLEDTLSIKSDLFTIDIGIKF